MLFVQREPKQSDVDKQRDRYMEYDAGKYPGAEFLKIADPFFGYRLNDVAKNRVILRTFLRDGEDGIVVTVSSRLAGFDAAYAPAVTAALTSARVGGGAAPPPEAAAAGTRRIFDKAGRFSVVAPLEWKPIGTEEGELLALGLKGLSSGPTLRIVEEGDQDNPAFVLMTIQSRWKKDYAAVSLSRVGTNPPALLAKNRKEGWIDYLVAFAAGGRGFTLRLAVREGAFEASQVVADQMAQSIVFMGDPYRAPEKLPGDLALDHKKAYVVHARAEERAAAEALVGEMAGFDRDWGKIAPAPARKGSPLHVVLAGPDVFLEVAHGFGEPPAAYDRLACAVVALAPPPDKTEAARHRARLYSALAEAALHRDLPVAPPPWLLAGLSACMDAAGRTGDGPGAPHAALVVLLKNAQAVAPLKDVFAYSYGQVLLGETPEPLAWSWGYTHLMLHGKGTLKTIYSKWERELPKASRVAPPLDLGKYADAEAELKKHVERELAQ
jgi:hypothetical protein